MARLGMEFLYLWLPTCLIYLVSAWRTDFSKQGPVLTVKVFIKKGNLKVGHIIPIWEYP